MGNLPNVVPAGQQSSRSMPPQINLMFDAVELQGMNAVQRAITLRHLACLLMQAAGISTAKGRNDDE